MPRGGKREGAGRKVGAVTKRTRERANEIAESGAPTPLDYMLGIMNNPRADNSRRDDMAKAAAPYVHAKLASVDANVKANVDGSITFTWLPATS